MTIDHRHDIEEDEADGEVDEGAADDAAGDDKAWEIDFADEVGIALHAEGGLGEGGGKGVPRDDGSDVEDGVGEAVGGHLGDFAEDQRERAHHEEGLKDNPDDAQGRLFVADFDIALDEGDEQFPVIPKVLQELPDPLVAFGADYCNGVSHR